MFSQALTPSEIAACFAKVQQLLQAQPWFQEAGWRCDVHPFPALQPDGLTLHVSKGHWLNDTHQGIHIESYLDFNPRKQARTVLTLHLLHTDHIPGTTLKRKQLTQAVVDRIEPVISQWPGYAFRVGKYGQQPFAKILDGTDPGFTDELGREIGALCGVVGPVVDQVLGELLEKA